MTTKQLLIVDELTFDDDGEVTGWACATNALGITDEQLGKCPAPENGCPRGLNRTFECREYGVDE